MTEEIRMPRAGTGQGRLGTAAVVVSSDTNRSRWLIATTFPLGERSVKW